MFANYDYSEFPIVHVYFTKTIENDDDFKDFLQRWLQLYNNEQEFQFIFHTESVGYVPIKYSIMMSKFIKTLKKRETQYLQKSIIIINSKIVKFLLEVIFFIQRPVAPVYIINTNFITYQNAIEKINNNIIDKNIKIIIP